MHAIGTRVVEHDISPVEHRTVEHDLVHERCEFGACEELHRDGATHGPPEQIDARGAVREGVLNGGLDVLPLGESEAVTPVEARRALEVVAVARDNAGDTEVVKHRYGTQGFAATRATPVDENGPALTVPGVCHPCGRGPVLGFEDDVFGLDAVGVLG